MWSSEGRTINEVCASQKLQWTQDSRSHFGCFHTELPWLLVLFLDGQNFFKCLTCIFSCPRTFDFYFNLWHILENFTYHPEQQNWIWGGYDFPKNQCKYGRVIPLSLSTETCWRCPKTWALQSREGTISWTWWLEEGLLITSSTPAFHHLPYHLLTAAHLEKKNIWLIQKEPESWMASLTKNEAKVQTFITNEMLCVWLPRCITQFAFITVFFIIDECLYIHILLMRKPDLQKG